MAIRPQTVEEFIRIVEKIEEEFPIGSTIERFRLIIRRGIGGEPSEYEEKKVFTNDSYFHITRLRKYWYDNFHWDCLIADRSIVPGFTHSNIRPETSKELKDLLAPMGQKDNKHFFVEDPIIIKDKKPEKISLPHLFCGLDAMHFPNSTLYFSWESKGVLGKSAKLESYSGATWAGDVGQSVCHEFSADEKWRAELIGDIDGIIMGANKSFTSDMLLSEMLRDYYFGASEFSARNRYSKFLTVNGMEFSKSGDSYRLSQASIDKIALQVDIFAAKWDTKKRLPLAWGVDYKKDSDLDFWVNKFVALIEGGLKRELG